MKKITTVLGAIEPEALGFVQPHEHLMISRGVSADINPAICIDDVDKSVQEVLAFRDAGGGTIIDAQPGGCNRVAEGLREIAERTGVHIIAATGFHKHIFYKKDHWIFTESKETIRDLFIHELEVGMYTNLEAGLSGPYIDSRAGIVKGANDVVNLTPNYEKCFRAAAEAAIHCEKPLMVHIEPWSDGTKLLKTLLAWGVQPHRILFCHMDRAILPISHYRFFLDAGISLEFDTIGRFRYHGDAEEAVLIKALLDLGYEDQILCSLDTTRERLKAYNPGGVGLTYLFTSFFPLLREHGVSQRQLDKISHDNIVRAFG